MYKFKDTTPISTEPTTVSGSIVTIDNIDDVIGIKSLVTEIEPIQSGSGTPSPTNVRPISGWDSVKVTKTGKNLLHVTATNATVNGVTFTFNADGSVTLNGTSTADNTFINLNYTAGKLEYPKDTPLKIIGGSSKVNVSVCGTVAPVRIGNSVSSTSPTTFTIASSRGDTATWARLYVPTNGTVFNNETIRPMIMFASEADYTFEPFGTTKDIPLRRTVYKGTLDVSTGLLTVTHGVAQITGINRQGVVNNSYYAYNTLENPADASRDTYPSDAYCDKYVVATKATERINGTFYLISGNIIFVSDAFTSVAEANTIIASQKPTVVYPLATPQTYQLSVDEVELIAGDNNLWSDSGNITVTYAVDERLYYTLPTEAVSINGRYLERIIDGYRTLYVEGRESLGIELDTYSVGTADGVRLRNKRYPARELKVGFQLIAGTAEEFRQRFNQLNNILSIGEADFIFNDERDKFFSGYPVMDANIETGTNSVKGEWTIYCAYPFKRSLEPITLTSTDDATVSGNSATFTFNYGGVIPAKPVLRCEFASAKSGGDYSEDGDCGYVAFLDADENIIQLGNPDVIDLDATNKNATLINSTFDALTGWTANGMSVASITDPQWNDGAGQTQSYAKGVGHLRRTFTGALNFEWDMVHRLAVSAPSQTGTFKVLLKNGNTTVIGYTIEKTGSGTAGTVKYIINGATVGKDTIDLSLYNPSFGYCNRTPVYITETYYVWVKKGRKRKKVKKTRQVQKGWEYTQSNLNSGISRNGGVVTFSIGNLADRTFKRSDIDTATITSVSIETTGNLGTNAIRSASLISKKGVAFNQIPNVFTAGDIVEADCNDANVYLYRKGSAIGHLEPQYGALGNDWENFEISVGTNVIRAVWSPWVNASYIPVIKIIFNEVFI